MIRAAIFFFAVLFSVVPVLAEPEEEAEEEKSTKPPTTTQICTLIGKEAEAANLPKPFFARLIWKESRFDPNAVSPAGAEGIAQFMPGTAKQRNLADPFDYKQAIPASAAFLADLKSRFGNIGLAAAAYNAGPGRVNRWLAGKAFLPFETEDYVASILGEPADSFSDASYEPDIKPLNAKLSFDEACRKLPALLTATIAMATVTAKPWGIQIAGSFRRGVALRSYERLKRRFPTLLNQHKAYVQRRRAPFARRGVYAVRIGADSRKQANGICQQLRRGGGACAVTRN